MPFSRTFQSWKSQHFNFRTFQDFPGSVRTLRLQRQLNELWHCSVNLLYKWRHDHLHAVDGEETSGVMSFVLVLTVVLQTFVYTANNSSQQAARPPLLVCVQRATWQAQLQL